MQGTKASIRACGAVDSVLGVYREKQYRQNFFSAANRSCFRNVDPCSILTSSSENFLKNQRGSSLCFGGKHRSAQSRTPQKTSIWSPPSSLRNISLCAARAPGDAVKLDSASLDTFLASLPPDLGTRAYTVALQKPLGIYFKETKNGVLVDELVEGGHADKFNMIANETTCISSGDRLLATSAFPNEGQSRARQPMIFPTIGESFDTVIAAIQSNTCANCYITLVLERAR